MIRPPGSDGKSDPLLLALHCAPRKPLLSILRRVVGSVAEEIGFADDDLCKIEMAVDEACANAITHAFPEGSELPHEGIELRLSIEADMLTIQVRNQGGKCSGGPVPVSDSIEDYARPGRDRYHGLGILIMRQFMDEVEFSTVADNGTLVTLRKALRSGPAGAA